MDEKTEFQQQFRRQLLGDGIFNQITAQFRSRIFQSLLSENGPPKSKTTQQEMALLSLLYHHLENRGYDCTLSVFAAESGMQQPLGLDECNKDNGDLSIGLLPLLQAGARHSANATNIDSSGNTTTQASKSVQTDQQLISYSDPKHDNENASVDTYLSPKSSQETRRSPTKLVEQRLVEIENECQQRMRHEMNEKLRLSAKKQAIAATRRLARKHNEEIQSLHHQIEVEQAIAQQRQEDITQRLSQKLLWAQSEKKEIEQKLETALLEKQTLQSEMALVNERGKQIQHEWSKEHETLSRAHRESLNDLEAQKCHLQTQINEIALQKEALASEELKHAATERERDNLRSEIGDLRRQLTKVQEMYDSSRNEVLGLQSLLKQSHTALQSLSFRDIGKGAPVLTSQLRPRETLKAGTNPHLAASLSPKSNGALVSSRSEPIINTSSSDAQAGRYLRGEFNNHLLGGVQQSRMLSNAKLNKQDSTANMNSNPKRDAMCEDPPCTSAEDPPEMIDRDGDDRHDNSVDTVIGREILLSLSAITKEQSTEKELAARVVSRQEAKVSAAKPSQLENDAKESKQIQVYNAEPVDSPNLNRESSEKVEKSQASTGSPGMAELKLLVSRNSARSIFEAQVSTSSLAAEADEIKSENYSECFDTLDEGHTRHGNERDSISGEMSLNSEDKCARIPQFAQSSNSPESESSNVPTGSLYTESFCSVDSLK